MATTEAIVRALIERQPMGVSQRRLLKLFYLAETKYVAETGKRLTDADFFRYDQGPYSKAVVNTARSLPEDVIIGQERTVTPEVDGVFFSPGRKCAPDLPDDIRAFIDDFMAIYGRERTEAIVSAAYRTAPFLAAGDRENIDFSGWVDTVDSFRNSGSVEAAIREGADRQPIFGCENLKELRDYLEGLRSPLGSA